MNHVPPTCRSQPSLRLSTVAVVVLTLAFGSTASVPPALAGQCTVPGTHDTVQAAVFDPSCDPIELAGATFEESVLIHRSLTLVGVDGGSTTIEGQVRVSESGTQIVLNDLTIRSGCPDATMDVETGANVVGFDIAVGWSAGLPCPEPPVVDVFADGFETGDTSRWSTTSP